MPWLKGTRWHVLALQGCSVEATCITPSIEASGDSGGCQGRDGVQKTTCASILSPCLVSSHSQAATVCQDDLTTPSTDTHASWNISHHWDASQRLDPTEIRRRRASKSRVRQRDPYCYKVPRSETGIASWRQHLAGRMQFENWATCSSEQNRRCDC